MDIQKKKRKSNFRKRDIKIKRIKKRALYFYPSFGTKRRISTQEKTRENEKKERKKERTNETKEKKKRERTN